MKTLRKLALGETWAVPIGVTLVLAAGLLLRGDDWWSDLGGFVLLFGVVATLFASLRGVP